MGPGAEDGALVGLIVIDGLRLTAIEADAGEVMTLALSSLVESLPFGGRHPTQRGCSQP